MNCPKLSVCYYPTTVVLVDDDKEYLNFLKFPLIERSQLLCRIYNDPQKALHFLTREYKAETFSNRCLLHEEDNDPEHHVVDFDVRAIQREIYNAHRFNEITVIVVDYSMPSMDGVEFCRQLRNKYGSTIKIIMLTGQADKDLAVRAFNEGVIDKFIMKDMEDLIKQLVQNIRDLQHNYFLRLSETVLGYTADFPQNTLACLMDPVFVDFFTRLCVEHNIVEYYLLDNQGSFLLLDKQGKPSWLAVANKEQMRMYCELLEFDQSAESMIKAIKAEEMLPFFFTDDDFEVRPAEWKKYLHPAKMLKGKETYWYSYITDSVTYEIEHDKVLSYQQQLQLVS